MKGREHHLQEERLFDCYLAARGGEAARSAGRRTSDRLRRLRRPLRRARREFMETLRTEAAAEADAVFTPERLRAQRLHISRRLEHLGHPARVITFPGRADGTSLRALHAAAGAPLDRGGRRRRTVHRRRRRGCSSIGKRPRIGRRRPSLAHGSPDASSTAPAGRARRDRIASIELGRGPSPFDSDEAFLSELELAGERPRIRELTAVDALTPHVREVTLR